MAMSAVKRDNLFIIFSFLRFLKNRKMLVYQRTVAVITKLHERYYIMDIKQELKKLKIS